MSRLLALGLVAILACSVSAGGNPDVRIYIDFDPPNYVHEFMPEPYTLFSAYICVDQLGIGLTTISLDVTDLQYEYPGMFAAVSFMSLLPGNLPIYPTPSGFTLYSQWCVGGGGEPLPIAQFDVFPLQGASACLEIRDHGDYPRWVVDCGEPGEVDQYCVLAHGSIGGHPCPDGDCAPVPVERGTWGTIKSLYR